MATIPATNPAIPFLARIPGGLHHGSMIRIIGRKTGYEVPIINIQSGPAISPSDDINLHLSIRPEENAIVRNHYQKDTNWGTEERSGGCPIRDHEQFEILILAQNNCFKVAVNGKHFCEFVHRLPFPMSKYLLINGNVQVTSVRLEYDSPHASAPPVSMDVNYQSISYQPPPTYQQSQIHAIPYQPMHQQHIQTPYPQYGSISATTHATPASSGYPVYMHKH